MHGPAPEKLPWDGPETVRAVMMQLSFVHTRKCTEWMTRRQVSYLKRQGGHVGVLPALWCFRRGEVEQAAPARLVPDVRDLSLPGSKLWARCAEAFRLDSLRIRPVR